MGFLTSYVKNGEIRPSHSYKVILEQGEERNQLNSCKEQFLICSSTFRKQKCVNFKTLAQLFSSFNPFRPICLCAEALNNSFIALG